MARIEEVVRYKPFEKHDNEKYHSQSLPLPNVVRIEVLSPEAKARYMGKFHSMMEGFRQSLTESVMPPDANKPFYAFFDPKENGDIGFDMNATWNQSQNTGINGIVNTLKNGPGIIGKAANIAGKGVSLAGHIGKAMGLDNTSTGSCTMKEFDKATFQFNKNITCRWYMPEQENMARLSISRLLKMAYVRNFDSKSRNNYAKKISEAFSAIKGQLTSFNDAEGSVGSGVNAVFEFGADVMSSATNLMGGVIDVAVNTSIGLNEFFGGSLTTNPMPVRLTLGHILDIEPLVITSVQIRGSKEQFMTTDGSNIPLFVTANIGFDMWMIPDPNKGYVQWLGDDVFNSGYASGTTNKGDANDNPGIMLDSTPASGSTEIRDASTPGFGPIKSKPELKGK